MASAECVALHRRCDEAVQGDGNISGEAKKASYILRLSQEDCSPVGKFWTLPPTRNTGFKMDDMSGSSPIESNAKSEPDADSDSVRPAMGNFTKLSWFMGKYNEMNIFRRYSFLQAQNLVGLQMELAHLEDQLDMIRDDKQRLDAEDPEKALVLDESQYWRALCDNSESEEYQKILEIRSKLKEYSQWHTTNRIGRSFRLTNFQMMH